jgi:hypothetical protein
MRQATPQRGGMNQPRANPWGGGAGGGGWPSGAPVDPYGTESGNTYDEQRYIDRMSGQDQAYNYAAKRGGEALDAQYRAAGGANSGARFQGESDMIANLTAQSQAQLDRLSGQATDSRQDKVDSMFNQGTQLAGGQAGTVAPYALGAAGAMSAGDQAYLQMLLGRSEVDGKTRQAAANTVIGGASLFAPRPKAY